jgi:fumarate hydratase class I
MDAFRESMLQPITETSTNLPPDVRRAMARALETEEGARSAQALNLIATNIDMACGSPPNSARRALTRVWRSTAASD